MRALAALILSALAACAGAKPDSRTTAPEGRAATPNTPGDCPARQEAPALLPGTRAEHTTLDYWLARYSAAELDTPLMTEQAIVDYNTRLGRRVGGHLAGQHDLRMPLDRLELERDIAGRLGYMRTRLERGELLGPDGDRIEGDALASFHGELDALTPSLRIALANTQLRCGPLEGPLYTPQLDTAYDRNACSTAHAQEPVQLIARWPNGMWLARTRYALGWLDAAAKLSEPIADAAAARWLDGPFGYLPNATSIQAAGGAVEIPAHTRLPLADDARVEVATATGVADVPAPEAPVATRRPLTRRALLTTAFGLLGSPYGFGGKDGGRDCSRLQLDLFESFDLALPRHSGWQAQAGSYRVPLQGKSEQERLRIIDAAAASGVVLLHLPGHVMLYLGRDKEGTPMALHALGEYAQPCANGGESVVPVQRTIVSTLELGRGSSRTALIERLTSIAVLGGEPPAALASLAVRAPAPPPPAPPSGEACSDSVDARIFVSPRTPQRGSELRVIATISDDPGNAELWLWDPEGQLFSGPVRRLGGPPFTRWRRVERPTDGVWTAALVDGERTLACKRIRVRPPQRAAAPQRSSEIWASRWSWERDTENLWAAFIEQLFDYPADDGRTWTGLSTLLRDRERNLLYDHFALDEDDKLELLPDCADLPYVLRAYFAWKLALPYGYRRCSRGRVGKPPSCGPANTNAQPREATSDLDAFATFVNRGVRSGVHSASGRTHPDDDATDLYPVALERDALTPGTVYADPYGHVMLLTRWHPQGSAGPHGVLMAAEAQPDKTVGRRRFWEGSFLFDPATDDVGAGFKHFRPLVREDDGTLRALDNAALAKTTEHARFSRAQYEGSAQDFYDHMDALINPEPLDATERLHGLVDALEESVRRRVLSVDNGEEYVAQHGARIPMPQGHDIFETEGPWEDYSTPSRDMRLLIAIDVVTGFANRVRRHPERFELTANQVDDAIEKLQGELKVELEKRRIEYTRSNGDKHTLSLADLVARSKALEVAYNPNDCIELRWGAPEGSAEASSCKRHAPAEQRERMARYREWFANRKRPPRGTR